MSGYKKREISVSLRVLKREKSEREREIKTESERRERDNNALFYTHNETH